VVGELLYVTGTDNRTIVYALQTGAKLREFFGYVVAADAETGRVCVANRSGEAAVYDSGGGQLADFYMGDPLRFAAFQDTEFCAGRPACAADGGPEGADDGGAGGGGAGEVSGARGGGTGGLGD